MWLHRTMVAALAAVLGLGTPALASPAGPEVGRAAPVGGMPEPGDPGYDADFQGFYEELTPHGDWLYHRDYGTVWRPNPEEVGPGFQPYATNGRWVDSDAGWSFESGWSWGWATFHYGRWALLPALGWVWVPGKVWGPSWCDWRVGDDVVGWAPLPPEVELGVSLPFTAAWVFVPVNSFVASNPYRFAYPRHRRHWAYRSTWHPRRGRFYGRRGRWSGPRPSWVARAGGVTIPRRHIAPPPWPGAPAVRSRRGPDRSYRPGPRVPPPAPWVRPPPGDRRGRGYRPGQAPGHRSNRVYRPGPARQVMPTPPGRRFAPLPGRQVAPLPPPRTVGPHRFSAPSPYRRIAPQQRQVAPQRGPRMMGRAGQYRVVPRPSAPRGSPPPGRSRGGGRRR